ncbi:OmpH family outer membrane protein [bacterium]|nr:OmpH family outer membrane protein [bacterium]
MKRTSQFIIALLLLGTGLLYSEVKIGYVNMEKIIAEYQPLQEVDKQLQREFERLQQERDNLVVRIDSLQNAFEKQSLMMSESRKEEKAGEIQALMMTVQEFETKHFAYPEGTIYKIQKDLEDPIRKQIKEVVDMVAANENFDLVFQEPGALLYADPKWDMTDDVLYELRREGE